MNKNTRTIWQCSNAIGFISFIAGTLACWVASFFRENSELVWIAFSVLVMIVNMNVMEKTLNKLGME